MPVLPDRKRREEGQEEPCGMEGRVLLRCVESVPLQQRASDGGAVQAHGGLHNSKRRREQRDHGGVGTLFESFETSEHATWLQLRSESWTCGRSRDRGSCSFSYRPPMERRHEFHARARRYKVDLGGLARHLEKTEKALVGRLSCASAIFRRGEFLFESGCT